MSRSINRVYVVKKAAFATEADNLLRDIRDNLGVASLRNVQIFSRYDVAGIESSLFREHAWSVFADPSVDQLYFNDIPIM